MAPTCAFTVVLLPARANSSLYRKNEKVRTLCLPGILQRGDEQFNPLVSFLPGLVMGMVSNGSPYDHDAFINAVMEFIEQAIANKEEVNLVGASMGGMQIPFIVQEWRTRNPGQAPTWLRKAVLIDAPTGPETMNELPMWAVPILASRPVGALMSTALGDWIVARMTVPPKTSEITEPSDFDAFLLGFRGEGFHEWVAFVQEKATAGLSGYTGAQWWAWLRWMITVGKDGSYVGACKSLSGVETWYVECTHPGNVTVTQPGACLWHGMFIKGLWSFEVNAVHCGFLQQRGVFVEALKRIFQ